jgi:hypothetical protein
MRTPVLLASILASALVGAPVLAQPHRGDNVDARGLSAEQVQRYAAVYYPAIRACYLELGKPSPGATGELAITIVIHRAGHVHDFALDAPGVRGKHLRKLEGCVRMQVIGWHFPVRRDFTTAVLPYRFMHLTPPGAGPQYSCWNPRGCPSRPATPPRR